MSERENCNRNSAITYFMKECGVIPPEASVEEALDTYTQFNNLTVNTDSLSVMAATLANGGICPLTGVSCLSNEGVKFWVEKNLTYHDLASLQDMLSVFKNCTVSFSLHTFFNYLLLFSLMFISIMSLNFVAVNIGENSSRGSRMN